MKRALKNPLILAKKSDFPFRRVQTLTAHLPIWGAQATRVSDNMDEQNLIYDWNLVDYEYSRDSSNHPHGVWFDDETLRDGLQSPSALNPSIDQKIELLTYMEKLGIQKVDLGLPGAGPFHLNHIDAMLVHIKENDFKIRPGAAVRTLMNDNECVDTLLHSIQHLVVMLNQ